MRSKEFVVPKPLNKLGTHNRFAGWEWAKAEELRLEEWLGAFF